MGENGAGKSTLMKCLFGVYQEDGGEIILDGKKEVITSSVTSFRFRYINDTSRITSY